MECTCDNDHRVCPKCESETFCEACFEEDQAHEYRKGAILNSAIALFEFDKNHTNPDGLHSFKVRRAKLKSAFDASCAAFLQALEGVESE
mgnify:CR=1 FL=1